MGQLALVVGCHIVRVLKTASFHYPEVKVSEIIGWVTKFAHAPRSERKGGSVRY